MSNNILYDAAVKYKKLENVGYHIVLGKKKSTYIIDLRFPTEAFFHLVGLQHLNDLTFPSKNKERIFKYILDNTITQQYLKKSSYYIDSKVEDRINLSLDLEKMIDQIPKYYRINIKEYSKYTDIKSDYLSILESLDELSAEIYYFLVHNYTKTLPSRFVSCSLFRKTDKDYTKGTSKTTLLLLEKITDIKLGTCMELYRNPHYKENIK